MNRLYHYLPRYILFSDTFRLICNDRLYIYLLFILDSQHCSFQNNNFPLKNCFMRYLFRVNLLFANVHQYVIYIWNAFWITIKVTCVFLSSLKVYKDNLRFKGLRFFTLHSQKYMFTKDVHIESKISNISKFRENIRLYSILYRKSI